NSSLCPEKENLPAQESPLGMLISGRLKSDVQAAMSGARTANPAMPFSFRANRCIADPSLDGLPGGRALPAPSDHTRASKINGSICGRLAAMAGLALGTSPVRLGAASAPAHPAANM